jgi:hypothetical protein
VSRPRARAQRRDKSPPPAPRKKVHRLPGGPVDRRMQKFAMMVTELDEVQMEDLCNICLEKLSDPSDHDDVGFDKAAVVHLPCNHMLHHNCVLKMVISSSQQVIRFVFLIRRIFDTASVITFHKVTVFDYG